MNDYLKPILEKIVRYCAYQERCWKEVNQKMKGFNLDEDETLEVVSFLSRENFVNETRYTKAFAKGKFRHNKWGKIKIGRELAFKNIPKKLINEALNEIADTDYSKQLNQLFDAKLRSIKETNHFKRKNKVATYLIQKGYEPYLVWDLVAEKMQQS